MAGQLTIDTLKASSGVLATQNGMTGIAKAWVNFGGTGTINGSFNVSSITYTATGQYAINFTTAMPNANYAVAGMSYDANAGGESLRLNAALTTTTCTVKSSYWTTAYNTTVGGVVIFSS